MPWLTTEGSSLYAVIFAVCFLWLSLALGRRLLILLGTSHATSPIERGVIAAALGAGALQFVPFSLGALGLLSTTSIRITIGVLVLAVAADLRAVAVAIVAAIRRQALPSSWTIAWLIALSPALLVAGLAALAPTLDPDGLAYHLTVPKRWMDTGRLDYLPTYPYSNAPMGVEMLFGLGLAFAGDAAAKCIHYVLGVMVAAPAIYLAGTRLAGRMVGVVPTTLFLVGPAGAATVLGYAYVEGAAAAATATSALSWLIWYQTGDRGHLRSATLLGGFAVSFKLTAVLFPVALLALTAIVLADKAHLGRKPMRGIYPSVFGLVSAASFTPFVAAPILPWLTRAFLLTGNPFFPVLANVIPSRDLPADLATQVDRWNRYMTWANSIGRDWTLEQRAWVLLGVAALLAVCGLLAFFKLHGRTARAVVVLWTGVTLVQLFAAGLYLRYWVPLAAVLMIPLAAAFASLLSRRPFVLAWIGLTLLGSLVHAHRSNVELGSNLTGLLRTVSGLDERVDFLRARLPLYSLYERANRDLPPGAGVLLSGYCGGFYIDRKTFCASSVQTSLRYTNWQDFAADMRRLGITHVIAPSALARGEPIPIVIGSSVSDITLAEQYQMVGQLLTQHARMLATASDQGLYEITPEFFASH